jgi:hypothetical protein
MQIVDREFTITKKMYIAFDGKEFENEYDCMRYEFQLIDGRLEFYDEDYQSCGCVQATYAIFRTEDEINDAKATLDYYGKSHEGIDKPGTYMLVYGSWYNIQDILSRLPWRNKLS